MSLKLGHTESVCSSKIKKLLNTYPCPKKITSSKIIGAVVIIAAALFFSIAAFYSAQMSFAIINTCFFAVVASELIISLLNYAKDLDQILPFKAPRQSKAFSMPYKRISKLKEDPDPFGISFPSARLAKVRFSSPFQQDSLGNEKKKMQHAQSMPFKSILKKRASCSALPVK